MPAKSRTATVLLGFLLAFGGQEAFSQDQTTEWLFVQNAESVSLKDGVLTLYDVSPTTLFFSDRPERIAAHGTTAEFVTFWQQVSDDGFGEDPPNAVLAFATGDTTDDIVLTLLEPELDGSTLRYAVTVLEGDDSAEGGPCSLFVDPVGMPLTPVSVAGTTRRVTRRTVRRMSY